MVNRTKPNERQGMITDRVLDSYWHTDTARGQEQGKTSGVDAPVNKDRSTFQ